MPPGRASLRCEAWVPPRPRKARPEAHLPLGKKPLPTPLESKTEDPHLIFGSRLPFGSPQSQCLESGRYVNKIHRGMARRGENGINDPRMSAGRRKTFVGGTLGPGINVGTRISNIAT